MKRKNDFERGYFCAVATLIRMDGGVCTQARELFRDGGDPTKADPQDIETFTKHKLMEPSNG